MGVSRNARKVVGAEGAGRGATGVPTTAVAGAAGGGGGGGVAARGVEFGELAHPAINPIKAAKTTPRRRGEKCIL